MMTSFDFDVIGDMPAKPSANVQKPPVEKATPNAPEPAAGRMVPEKSSEAA